VLTLLKNKQFPPNKKLNTQEKNKFVPHRSVKLLERQNISLRGKNVVVLYSSLFWAFWIVMEPGFV